MPGLKGLLEKLCLWLSKISSDAFEDPVLVVLCGGWSLGKGDIIFPQR